MASTESITRWRQCWPSSQVIYVCYECECDNHSAGRVAPWSIDPNLVIRARSRLPERQSRLCQKPSIDAHSPSRLLDGLAGGRALYIFLFLCTGDRKKANISRDYHVTFPVDNKPEERSGWELLGPQKSEFPAAVHSLPSRQPIPSIFRHRFKPTQPQ